MPQEVNLHNKVWENNQFALSDNKPSGIGFKEKVDN